MEMYFNVNLNLETLMYFFIIIAYILVSLLLNSYHKLIYKEKSVLAFFPFTNLYVLGKLVYNKTLGYVLVTWFIMIMEFNLNIFNYNLTISLFSSDIRFVIMIIYLSIIFLMLIYITIKYILKNLES